MQKIFLSLFPCILVLFGKAQSINGTFMGLELNGLTIDSAGQVYFYGIDSFPGQRWFHEVKVIIESNSITVDKYPVYYDKLGKTYSASDGGFITYGGSLKKAGEVYIATTTIISHDYIGFSVFEPPQISNDTSNLFEPPSTSTLDKDMQKDYDYLKEKGLFIYFPKGTLRQDYIIRYDKNGIWLTMCI